MNKRIDIIILLLTLCFSVRPVLLSGDTVEPVSCREDVSMLLSGNEYTYSVFSGSEPLKLTVSGPARLTVITRLLMPDGGKTELTYHVAVTRDDEQVDLYILSGLLSSKAKMKDHSGYGLARPATIEISVPPGSHAYSFILEKPEKGLAAASASLARPWEWRLTAAVASTYDDNVYRYSPGDIDDFLYHRADYRFRMETYDDLVTSPSLTCSITRRFSPDVTSRLRFRYGFNLYAVNGESNYQTMSASLRTTLQGGTFLQVGVFHLPKYLIRPYRDEDTFSMTSKDPDTYKNCDFTRNLYAVKTGHRLFRTIQGALYYERDVLYYSPHFTEYDTKANALGAEIRFDPAAWLQAGFEYAFKRAEARGYDEPGETKAASDDSDISYDEDFFQGSLRTDLARLFSRSLDLTLRYRLARRSFTTDTSPEDDPFHAGRRDDIHRLSLLSEYKINHALSFFGEYTFQTRDVFSPEAERITEVKNYDRNRISLGFEWTYQ